MTQKTNVFLGKKTAKAIAGLFSAMFFCKFRWYYTVLPYFFK